MKVLFQISHYNGFEHVLAAYTTRNTNAQLAEFEDEIRKRFPRFDEYYWRHRPSREEHRNFTENHVKIQFRARFSIRLDRKPHANPAGESDGTPKSG